MPNTGDMDLIFAESTPPGKGGVSIVRLSGRGARSVVEALAGGLSKPRHCYFRKLQDAGEVLDQAMVVWFEHNGSFTGEESAELHLHGAPVVIARLGVSLRNLGARLAEPGEFIRRAFLNGRVDLAEAEGLSDLLAAETEAQRVLALRTASGEMTRMTDLWRDSLTRAGALIEVSIDFADEEVPDDVPEEVYTILTDLRDRLNTEIGGFPAAERLRKGFEVALVGPVNAGKSSLVNRILRRDVALVSNIEGTTRDVIEARLDIQGLAVTLLDMAGLRNTSDRVEEMGIERAKHRAKAADLRLHLSDTGSISEELWRDGDILVRSKADTATGPGEGHAVSALTGAGVDDLLAEIYNRLSQRVAGAGVASHERQVRALIEARDAITDIEGKPPEILAESVRRAADSLSRLLGRIGAEEYLEVIFSSFCIGK